jgi:hypothetical protein
MTGFIEKLKADENLKKLNIVCEIVENELNFFKGNYLCEGYKFHHLQHSFLVYKLDNNLIDYYILGNHLMKCDELRVNAHIVYIINKRKK